MQHVRHVIVLLILPFLTGCRGEVPTPTAETPPVQTAEPAVNAESTPQSAESDDTRTEPVADLPNLIASVDELQSRLDEEGLRIVDTRPAGKYSEGHVPGAVRVDLDDWKSLSLSENGLQNAHAWSLRVGQLGVTADTAVIVYGESPTNAARIWWLLKYVGVTDVRMLDGGWTHWQAAGAQVSTDGVGAEPAEFIVDFQSDRLAEQDEVSGLSNTLNSATLLDTRSTGEHEGSSGPTERRGHIPGFQHLEWSEFLAEDGRFKSPEEINAILAEHQVADSGPSIVHCQSGGRAAFAALALELAGHDVKNYYCGWSEWSADEEAPVESSPE